MIFPTFFRICTNLDSNPLPQFSTFRDNDAVSFGFCISISWNNCRVAEVCKAKLWRVPVGARTRWVPLVRCLGGWRARPLGWLSCLKTIPGLTVSSSHRRLRPSPPFSVWLMRLSLKIPESPIYVITLTKHRCLNGTFKLLLLHSWKWLKSWNSWLFCLSFLDYSTYFYDLIRSLFQLIYYGTCSGGLELPLLLLAPARKSHSSH